MRDLERLAAYVAARETVPFAWGTNDCITFAAGAVRAVAGWDPLDGIEPWSDEAGAMRLLGARGGTIEAVSAVLDEVPTAMAMRGDVAALAGRTGALVVVEGLTLVGPGPNGNVRMPRSMMVAAWSAERGSAGR